MVRTSLTAGRTKQKKRTRAALIAAAADLTREGKIATVPDAAERASVSRATAYRYFPSQESLELEAAGAILASSLSAKPSDGGDQAIEPAPTSPEDCVKRVEKLEKGMSDAFWKDEQQVRLVLKSQMELWLAMKRDSHVTMRRPGRALPAIDAALAPLKARLSASDYEKLSGALAMVTGSEAIIALLDAAGIREPEKVAAIRRFALQAIFAAALDATDLSASA
jgi:AcrR family transcriptional regulator